jgi:hypothetical protein
MPRHPHSPYPRPSPRASLPSPSQLPSTPRTLGHRRQRRGVGVVRPDLAHLAQRKAVRRQDLLDLRGARGARGGGGGGHACRRTREGAAEGADHAGPSPPPPLPHNQRAPRPGSSPRSRTPPRCPRFPAACPSRASPARCTSAAAGAPSSAGPPSGAGRGGGGGEHRPSRASPGLASRHGTAQQHPPPPPAPSPLPGSRSRRPTPAWFRSGPCPACPCAAG